MTTSASLSERRRRGVNLGPSTEKKPLRPNSGARNGKARLSLAQVMEIRELRGKATLLELAERYGVSRSQISKVQLRRQWSHLA